TLVVDVKNVQGLDVASEEVSVTLAPPAGAPTTKSHVFSVNGNLGTFSVRFPRSARGQVTVQVTPRDGSDAPTGRATATLPIGGESQLALSVALVRKLAGAPGILMGGLPGGAGNRDGGTGPTSKLTARLSQPQAMAILDGNTYLLERCALRRVVAGVATG